MNIKTVTSNERYDIVHHRQFCRLRNGFYRLTSNFPITIHLRVESTRDQQISITKSSYVESVSCHGIMMRWGKSVSISSPPLYGLLKSTTDLFTAIIAVKAVSGIIHTNVCRTICTGCSMCCPRYCETLKKMENGTFPYSEYISNFIPKGIHCYIIELLKMNGKSLHHL